MTAEEKTVANKLKVEASMVMLLIGKFKRNAHCLLKRGRAWRKMR
jgi:hypothetical protein